MPKVHVLFKREDIDPERLAGKVVVVLDILFATTTIVDVIARGAACVHAVRNRDEAAALAAQIGSCVLAGEHMARPLEGFQPATPLALADHDMRGATFVYCTTNGTQALATVASANCAAVYVGALLNAKALVAHIAAHHPNASVLVVCSGSMNRFNLEDFHGAGYLVAQLLNQGDYAATDAALAAVHAYRGCDTPAALRASRVGQMMDKYGLGDEVAFAGRCDSVEAIPLWVDGRLVDARLFDAPSTTVAA